MVEVIPEGDFPCLSEGSFRGKSLQWIWCPDSGESTSGSSRTCRLVCRCAGSFFAACAHLLWAAEFLFKPYLQDSTFFPRCCDTSWWSALVTNTFMLRLNGCSLEVRRGFTALPGLGCLPWAQAVGFPLMSLQQTFCSCYFSVLLSHCHLAVSAKIVAHIRNCKYRWQERIPALDNSV